MISLTVVPARAGLSLKSAKSQVLGPDIGVLLPVLAEFSAPPTGVIVVFASRDNLAAKSRAMMDYLVEKSC